MYCRKNTQSQNVDISVLTLVNILGYLVCSAARHLAILSFHSSNIVTTH